MKDKYIPIFLSITVLLCLAKIIGWINYSWWIITILLWGPFFLVFLFLLIIGLVFCFSIIRVLFKT